MQHEIQTYINTCYDHVKTLFTIAFENIKERRTLKHMWHSIKLAYLTEVKCVNELFGCCRCLLALSISAH